jgi:hypothetical protein
MNQFSAARFWRVIQNDALRVAWPLLYCTVVLLGLTLLIYVSVFEAGDTMSPPASAVLFGIYLIGGGMVLTSMAFQDMHHPLERYRYLMLPCSNLERFLSRYLLTGPLFLLYALASFVAIDRVANLLTDLWIGEREPLFSPLSAQSLVLLRVYLFAHIAVLTGAICFRSYALIRTALFLLLGFAVLLAVAYLAMRIFYWDHFSWTRFSPVQPLGLLLIPLFAATWMNFLVAIGFLLWLLRVAYRCLCGHEVQGGL